MARTDPTDTGGLFIGRRPGTAPVKYRALPQRGSEARRRFDQLLAALVLVAMVFTCLLFFGPIPAGWLWIGARFDYWFDTITLAIAVSFIGMLLTLMGGLKVVRVLDQTWILIRRAAGYDQREGVMGRIFAITAVLAAVLFFGWLFLLAGPGSTLAPGGG